MKDICTCHDGPATCPMHAAPRKRRPTRRAPIKGVAKVTTETTYQLEISGEDLRRLLVMTRVVTPEQARSLSLTVRVPGGGDWSNTNLDLCTEAKITASWKTKQTREQIG